MKSVSRLGIAIVLMLAALVLLAPSPTGYVAQSWSYAQPAHFNAGDFAIPFGPSAPPVQAAATNNQQTNPTTGSPTNSAGAPATNSGTGSPDGVVENPTSPTGSSGTTTGTGSSGGISTYGTSTTGAPGAGPGTAPTNATLQVVSSNPQRNAVNVPVGTQILVVFNQKVRPHGVPVILDNPAAAANVNVGQMLRVAGANQWVAGQGKLQADQRTAVFFTQNQLGPDTQYEIVLDSWESLTGQAVAPGDRVLPFKTGHGISQAVQLIDPANQAALPTDKQPTFRWQTHPTATGYIFIITDKMPTVGALGGSLSSQNPPMDGFLDEKYGVLRIQTTGNAPDPITLTLAQWTKGKALNKPLYWAVRAVTGPQQPAGDVFTTSEYRLFTAGQTSAKAGDIVLVKPVNFANVTTLLPTFEWKYAAAAPKGATYKLVVSDKQNKPLYQAETLETTLTYDELAPKQLSKGGNYGWQVALIDSKNQVIAKSEVGKFTVGSLPDLVQVTPREDQGKKLLASDSTFKWTPPMGMTYSKYRITITQAAPGGDTPVLTQTNPSNAANKFGYPGAATALQDKPTYRWKIEALDDTDAVIAQSPAVDFKYQIDKAVGDLELVSVTPYTSKGEPLALLPGVKGVPATFFVDPNEIVEFRAQIRNNGVTTAQGHTLNLGIPIAGINTTPGTMEEIHPVIPQGQKSSPAPKPNLTPGGGEIEAVVAMAQTPPAKEKAAASQTQAVDIPSMGISDTVNIPDVAPGAEITLSISYAVQDTIKTGAVDPVRVALDNPLSGNTKKLRDFGIFDLFGFKFKPNAGTAKAINGGYTVSGDMRMARQDFLPKMGESGTPWIIPMNVQVSATGAKVLAGRLKQNTHITLYRFSTDLADGLVDEPDTFQVAGQLTVPYSKGNNISINFGKLPGGGYQFSDTANQLSGMALADPSLVGSPSGTFQFAGGAMANLGGAATAQMSQAALGAIGGNTAYNASVAVGNTATLEGGGAVGQWSAGIPVSEAEPLSLNPDGLIESGTIAIPSWSYNRPLVVLEGYDGPKATLMPWTIYLGWRGMILRGPTREELLPKFELNPSLPMSLPCHGTGKLIAENSYSAAALQSGLQNASLGQTAQAQASQDYMITDQAQFGGMNGPNQSPGLSTLNQDYLNAVLGDLMPASPDAIVYFQAPYCIGGLIHYCEGDAVEAWWLNIEQNCPRFPAFNWWRGADQPWWHNESLSGYLSATGFKAKNLAFDPWAWWPGEHNQMFDITEFQKQHSAVQKAEQKAGGGSNSGGMTGQATQTQGSGFSSGVSSLLGDFASVDEMVSNAGNYWLGDAKPAEPDPGNHISGSNVAMDNLGLLFRTVEVEPNRTLRAGSKVYTVYDLAIIDETGIHMNADSTEKLPLPDDFYVGDFKIHVTSKGNPGAGAVTLPGGTNVSLTLANIGIVDVGGTYKATSGTITPSLPSGGLAYNFGGYPLTITGIDFQLAGYDPGIYLGGKLALPAAYKSGSGAAFIGFKSVKITSSGRFLASGSDFNGQSFSFGMFAIKGKSGSQVELKKMESDQAIGIKVSNFVMGVPGPGQSTTNVNVGQVSVKPAGLVGTAAPPGAFDIGAAGFKIGLSGASINFAAEPSVVIHIQTDTMRIYPSGGTNPLVSLNHQGFDLESPAAWSFHKSIGASLFDTLTLSDGVRVTPAGNAIIDLSTNWGDGAHASDKAWTGITLGGGHVTLPGYGGAPDASFDCTGGLDVTGTGAAGSLSASTAVDKNWNPGGFALKFQNASIAIASDAVSKIDVPSATLSITGIGVMPIQNLTVQHGSGLIPVGGTFSGSQALKLFGFGLTLQSAQFNNTGFKMTSASLNIGSSPVSVSNVTFNGKGEIIDGSISFTGPATFALGNGTAFNCQVTADSGQLDSAGLTANGGVSLGLPIALQPLKPANWPDTITGKFAGIKFNSALCVAADKINLDVGTAGKNYVDGTGVVLTELKTAVPAVGNMVGFGGFSVKLTSVTGPNFLNVSGTAELTLPSGFPVSPNKRTFSFSGVTMDQQGGWHVTSGSADVITSPVDYPLAGDFKLTMTKFALDADPTKNAFQASVTLPGKLLANQADVVSIPFGIPAISPASNLYAEGINLTGPVTIIGGFKLSDMTALAVDFAAAQSPGGQPNPWQGVFIGAGSLTLPATLDTTQHVAFTNLAAGTDGINGQVALSSDPAIAFSVPGWTGFGVRFSTGTLTFAANVPKLKFSGDLLLPSGVFSGDAALPLSNVDFNLSDGSFYSTANWTGSLDLFAGMKLQSGAGTTVVVDASPAQSPASKANGWKGVLVSNGSVTLPSPFEGANATFTTLEINTLGVSGQLTLKSQSAMAIPFGVDSFNVSFNDGSITLADNKITSASINGAIQFPATFQKVGGGAVSVPFTGLNMNLSGQNPSFGLVFANLANIPAMTFAGFALDLGTGGMGIDLSTTSGIANYTDAPFQGVVFYSGALKLTKLFGGNIEIPFKFNNLVIGTSGLTGTLHATNIQPITLPLMPTFEFGLSTGRATFEQNALTELVFTGHLTLPKEFTTQNNQPAKVSFDHMAVSLSGDFSIQGANLPVVTVGGFSVECDNVSIDYSNTWTPANSKGFGPNWHGVYFLGGKIIFPTSKYYIAAANGPLSIGLTGAYIGTDGKLAGDGGITSSVTAQLTGCNGMDITFTSAVVKIKNNAWEQSAFSGYIELPTTVFESVQMFGTRPKMTFSNAALEGNGDFYKTVELEPTRVFGFEIPVTSAQFDYSATKSPQITGAVVASGGTAPSQLTWRGLFIPNTVLALPYRLKRDGAATAPTVRMTNFYVDSKGATGSAQFDGSLNLLGGIAGFPFDLKSFNMTFAASTIQNAGANISLTLPPLTETSEKVSVDLTFSETGFSTQVTTPGSSLKMHQATIIIDSITYSISNMNARLVLNGKLAVDAVKNGQPIPFSNLPISLSILAGESWYTADGSTTGTFRGFDVMVDTIGIGTKNGALFVGIAGNVSISAGGMLVNSPFKAGIRFDGSIDAEKIKIDSDWKGMFQVKGEADFHEEGSPTPGGAEDTQISEFRGTIPINLNIGGPVGFDISYRIGHKGDIYYCGFSAEVTMPVPIQLSPLPIAIYSFIGGFAVNLDYTPGGQNILDGTPMSGKFVFQAGVGVCTSDGWLVHGPVTLTVSLGGGSFISEVALEGTFYLCSSIGETPDNRYAKGKMILDFNTPSFTAGVEVYLGLDLFGIRVVKASGWSEFYISPSEIHLYIGTPDSPVGIEVLNSGGADGYCMLKYDGNFKIEFGAGWSYGFDWGVVSAGTWFSFGGSVSIPELQICGHYGVGGGATFLGCGGSVSAGFDFCLPPGICMWFEVCTEVFWCDVSCDKSSICIP